MNEKIRKNDIVYYARIMPKLDVYDVYDLKVRTVENTYFSTIDKKTRKVICFLIMILVRLYFLIGKKLLIRQKKQKRTNLK